MFMFILQTSFFSCPSLSLTSWIFCSFIESPTPSLLLFHSHKYITSNRERAWLECQKALARWNASFPIFSEAEERTKVFLYLLLLYIQYLSGRMKRSSSSQERRHNIVYVCWLYVYVWVTSFSLSLLARVISSLVLPCLQRPETEEEKVSLDHITSRFRMFIRAKRVTHIHTHPQYGVLVLMSAVYNIYSDDHHHHSK